MDETKEDLSTLRNHLEGIKGDIQKIISSEAEKKISFDEKIKKYESIIPLLDQESKKKESELNIINQKITTKTKISISKQQQEELEKLKQIEQKLKIRISDGNKNLKMAEKDSDQLLSLQSEVARLKSENLAYKKAEATLEQSDEDIEESASLDNFENRSFDAPEDILKYRTLIEAANKIIAGYYEGCEITQAKNFYKEVLGTGSEFKLDRKFDETLVHDITRSLKNYETEYQMKLLDFERESTDVKLKNQSLKSDSAVSENDLFFETQKKNSNSGEFVGGGDFFVSFSDIMSVLLCFFVVFFSITDQSQEAFDAFFATWPFKNEDKTIIKPYNASLSDQELKLMGKVKELVESGISPEAIIRDDTQTIELILSNSDLFLPGKIKLSPNGSIILKEKLKDILSKGGIRQIRIEGHTEEEDFSMHQKLIKKYSNNLAFSIARASAVSQILNKSFKFPEKLTIITGFGAKQPIKLNPLNLDKNTNSRIEIKALQDKNIKKTT